MSLHDLFNQFAVSQNVCYNFVVLAKLLPRLTNNRSDRPIETERMSMKLLLPREILMWVDENRGDLSRQAFIVKCIIKMKEIRTML